MNPHGTRRFIAFRLAEAKSTVTVTRCGTFSDPRYGQFSITPTMLTEMVSNFNKRVYGQDIFIDVAHKPDDGAAAKITRLHFDGQHLLADVEWTAWGRQAVKERGFQYLSAEYHEDYQDNETGRRHGAVLQGAGLTVRPVIKNLQPVQLSAAADSPPTFVHPDLLTLEYDMQNYLDQLKAALSKKQLNESAQTSLLNAFQGAVKLLGESPEDDKLKSLLQTFVTTADQVAQTAAPVTLSVQLPEPTAATLTVEDVRKLLDEQRADEQRQRKLASDTLQARHKLFHDSLNAAKGLQGLSDDSRKQLASAAKMITPDMTEDQVKLLAAYAIEQGQQLAVQSKLSNLGWRHGPSGTVRIESGPDQTPMKLQEIVHRELKNTAAFANRRLRLAEDAKLPPFCRMVLAEFDRLNGHRLDRELKLLAGETTGLVDTDLPLGVQREVIREALSDLRILELVQTLTDPTAQQTTQVPYETRDGSQIRNDGIVFERQGIPGASVKQEMDLAYILAMKLALDISNEVMHFTVSSQINWDAWGRNIESNARFMRELISRRILNTMQREADSYGSAAVVNESLVAQLDGTKHTVKTVAFPIVRPYQQYNMRGQTIGSISHPMTIEVNGDAVLPWDGTGTQAAGTYWRVTSYNLGHVQFVNKDGVPQTPTHASGNTRISYHSATNVAKFDLKLPANTRKEVHLNGLLQVLGRRKAIMLADRYVLPNFMLMNPILNDEISNAENFTSAARREDADVSSQGDLLSVKGIPAWSTNAPSDLGDERIILGQRATLSYVIAKPFMTGMPFEAVDSNGRPTGAKVAYGEEYSAIHVPAPIRNRFTSVLVYDSDAR